METTLIVCMPTELKEKIEERAANFGLSAEELAVAILISHFVKGE